MASDWLNYEVGALSKTVEKTYVCPFLHGLRPADLKGPLALFQAAESTRDDTRRMIQTLNKALGDKALREPALDKAFGTYWPELEARLRDIRPAAVVARRADRELLEEILSLMRGLVRESEFDVLWDKAKATYATATTEGGSGYRIATVGDILKESADEAARRGIRILKAGEIVRDALGTMNLPKKKDDESK
jgi:hypothetical protein